MDNFSVLHITKYKALGPIGRHIDRKHVTSNVDGHKCGFNEELTRTLGKSIDPTKTHLSEELSKHAAQDLPKTVERRIAQGYT